MIKIIIIVGNGISTFIDRSCWFGLEDSLGERRVSLEDVQKKKCLNDQGFPFRMRRENERK